MDKYIYLDKEYAQKGISLVLGISSTPIENYKKYYEGKAIEFKGNNLPHYITYIKAENGEPEHIREATYFEQYQMGLINLKINEVAVNNEIISYNNNTQIIKNGEIINKTRKQLIQQGIITLESEKEKARVDRQRYLQAVDLYDKEVLRMDITENVEQKKERDIFRQKWLDVPADYTDISIPIEETYPTIPKLISYFFK